MNKKSKISHQEKAKVANTVADAFSIIGEIVPRSETLKIVGYIRVMHHLMKSDLDTAQTFLKIMKAIKEAK